jgi:hypothetical protein
MESTPVECEGAGSEPTVEPKPTTKSTAVECEGTSSKSTVEAKAGSKSTVECKGTATESAMESESTMESKAAPAKAHLINTVADRLCDTRCSPAGKSRCIQHQAADGNCRCGQTNRYLAHHGAHSIALSTPAFSNQTQRFPSSCSRAAQSRGAVS